MRCFAHDVNNQVKQVLKTTFRTTARDAAAIVNALNASSSKWLQCLREIMTRYYGKSLALFALCETRWNSMQACFGSILRAKMAITVLCYDKSEYQGFSAALEALQKPGFWRDLAEAERVIRPFSVASYRLQ